MGSFSNSADLQFSQLAIHKCFVLYVNANKVKWNLSKCILEQILVHENHVAVQKLLRLWTSFVTWADDQKWPIFEEFVCFVNNCLDAPCFETFRVCELFTATATVIKHEKLLTGVHCFLKFADLLESKDKRLAESCYHLLKTLKAADFDAVKSFLLEKSACRFNYYYLDLLLEGPQPDTCILKRYNRHNFVFSDYESYSELLVAHCTKLEQGWTCSDWISVLYYFKFKALVADCSIDSSFQILFKVYSGLINSLADAVRQLIMADLTFLLSFKYSRILKIVRSNSLVLEEYCALLNLCAEIDRSFCEFSLEAFYVPLLSSKDRTVFEMAVIGICQLARVVPTDLPYSPSIHLKQKLLGVSFDPSATPVALRGLCYFALFDANAGLEEIGDAAIELLACAGLDYELQRAALDALSLLIELHDYRPFRHFQTVLDSVQTVTLSADASVFDGFVNLFNNMLNADNLMQFSNHFGTFELFLERAIGEQHGRSLYFLDSRVLQLLKSVTKFKNVDLIKDDSSSLTSDSMDDYERLLLGDYFQITDLGVGPCDCYDC